MPIPSRIGRGRSGIAVGSVTEDQFTFASGSRVWVEGTSTIHDWSCEARRLEGNFAAESGADRITAISGVTVTIPVSSLDCDNSIMSGKLRDALAAAPNIGFSLSSARLGSVNNGPFAIEASGRLSIAGTTQTIDFFSTGRALSNRRFRITGSIPFAMSRFGVKPPIAPLGTARTRDHVTVRFDVIVEPSVHRDPNLSMAPATRTQT